MEPTWLSLPQFILEEMFLRFGGFSLRHGWMRVPRWAKTGPPGSRPGAPSVSLVELDDATEQPRLPVLCAPSLTPVSTGPVCFPVRREESVKLLSVGICDNPQHLQQAQGQEGSG